MFLQNAGSDMVPHPRKWQSSETKFNTHIELQAELWFCIFFWPLDRDEKTKGSGLMAASITQIQSPPNILLNQILMYYYNSQIFKLSYIFRGFLWCL
jgi:hypothetical protein